MRRSHSLVVLVLLVVPSLADAQPRLLPASPLIGPRSPRGQIIVTGSFGGGYVFPAGGWRYPYGIVEPRTSIQIFVAEPPPFFFAPALDLSGIDLDTTAPPWAKEFERAPLPERKPKPDEPAIRVEPVKNAPAKVKAVDPKEPKADPGEESLRLTLLGLAAFRGQEYGLAARKFSQAMDVDPKASRAYFFLGQSQFALGKYSDAVQMIGLGLALDPNWPKMPFRPRFDLYNDHPEDWLRHMKLLDDAQARQPQHVGYLFLSAHQRWFDDQPAEATKLFKQVRPLVADPTLVDLFVKAKGP